MIISSKELTNYKELPEMELIAIYGHIAIYGALETSRQFSPQHQTNTAFLSVVPTIYHIWIQGQGHSE